MPIARTYRFINLKKSIRHASFPILHIGSIVKSISGGVSFLGNRKYGKEVEKARPLRYYFSWNLI
jgi:hypothetical protein